MIEADAEDSIPPEWPTLADLPRWVDRVHGVRSDAITRELYLAVRSTLEIPHRVSCKPRDRTNSPGLPPGLVHEVWHGIRRVFVADWEAAEADGKAGTVGGWKQADGTRERLPVEVLWEPADHFVRMRLWGWKRDAAGASQAKAAAVCAMVTQIPDPADRPDGVTPNEWMADYAKAQLALNGVPVKRDPALRACMLANRCTYREAYPAWMAVPASLKRNSRQTDRALTGH